MHLRFLFDFWRWTQVQSFVIQPSVGPLPSCWEPQFWMLVVSEIRRQRSELNPKLWFREDGWSEELDLLTLHRSVSVERSDDKYCRTQFVHRRHRTTVGTTLRDVTGQHRTLRVKRKTTETGRAGIGRYEEVYVNPISSKTLRGASASCRGKERRSL